MGEMGANRASEMVGKFPLLSVRGIRFEDFPEVSSKALISPRSPAPADIAIRPNEKAGVFGAVSVPETAQPIMQKGDAGLIRERIGPCDDDNSHATADLRKNFSRKSRQVCCLLWQALKMDD